MSVSENGTTVVVNIRFLLKYAAESYIKALAGNNRKCKHEFWDIKALTESKENNTIRVQNHERDLYI